MISKSAGLVGLKKASFTTYKRTKQKQTKKTTNRTVGLGVELQVRLLLLVATEESADALLCASHCVGLGYECVPTVCFSKVWRVGAGLVLRFGEKWNNVVGSSPKYFVVLGMALCYAECE